MEEQYGLRSQVMAVYERGTAAVLPEDRFEVNVIIIFSDSSNIQTRSRINKKNKNIFFFFVSFSLSS